MARKITKTPYRGTAETIAEVMDVAAGLVRQPDLTMVELEHSSMSGYPYTFVIDRRPVLDRWQRPATVGPWHPYIGLTRTEADMVSVLQDQDGSTRAHHSLRLHPKDPLMELGYRFAYIGDFVYPVMR